jgi:MFS family permease
MRNWLFPSRANYVTLPAVTQATRLPRTTRLFLAGNTVSMVGTGLVLPFILIYLHQVRGIPLPVVGALLAGAAGAGLVVVPMSGMLIDHFGVRVVLVAIMIGQSIADVSLALAHNVPTALPAVLLYGACWSPMFPTLGTMIAALTPHPVMQQRAFAINFTAQNAALGTGAAVGAVVAGTQNPASFEALFIANAVSCMVFVAVLPFIPTPRRTRQRSEAKVGYREVLAYPGLRLVILASLLIAFTGYAAFDSGLPAFSTVVAHVSIHVVALSFTVNTTLIVAVQLLVLRLIRRRRRSFAVWLTGLIWAVSWAVLGLAALPIPSAARIACVFAFTGLFGLGETFIAPTMGPLVNSLVDDRVRGRANSIGGFTTSLALIASPAIVTGFIAAGAAAAWIALLCLGCLGTVGIGVTLGRRLTDAQDHVGVPSAAVAAPDRSESPDPAAATAGD